MRADEHGLNCRNSVDLQYISQSNRSPNSRTAAYPETLYAFMRLALIIIFSLTISCNNAARLPVTVVANESFFQADQSNSFEKLVAYYQQQTYLKNTTPELDYVLYPPLSALVDTSAKYEFSFTNHPKVPALDEYGQLIIHRLGHTVAEPELIFSFKARESAAAFVDKYIGTIEGKPSIDSRSQGGQLREVQYSLPEGRSLKVFITPGVRSGYMVRIRYKQGA